MPHNPLLTLTHTLKKRPLKPLPPPPHLPVPLPSPGLPSGSRIFYRVGIPGFDQWSSIFNFTTFKAVSNFPFLIGVMADLGLSNSTISTVNGMKALKPNLVLNVGDLAYADLYLPSGEEGTIKDYKYLLSYQPRWDMYGRLLQRLASGVPMMTSTGAC